MIPDEMSPESRAGLLAADVIGPPIVFLASAEAEGLTSARIVSRDWQSWLADLSCARRRGRLTGSRRGKSVADRGRGGTTSQCLMEAGLSLLPA